MKKIFKVLGITLISLILVFIVVTLIYVININISKKNTKKFIEEKNKLTNESFSYMIVEINPKAILEIKNNKINNLSCLNDDCERIFNVDIKDMTISNAVKVLYESAKNNGISINNGVNVYSTNQEIKNELKDLNYVKYNTITRSEEIKYIEESKNNKEILNNKNEQNKKVLELYKNDSDYGKLYTCDIVNDLLECYILREFYDDVPAEPSMLNIYDYNTKHQRLMNVLDKFNIEYEISSSDVEGFGLFKINEIKNIKINGVQYKFGVCSLNSDTTTTCFNDIVIDQILESGEYGYLYKVIPLFKLDLVNLKFDPSEIVEHRNYQSTNIVGPGQVD